MRRKRRRREGNSSRGNIKQAKLQTDSTDHNDPTSKVEKSERVGVSTLLSRKSIRLRRRSDDAIYDNLLPLTQLTWDAYRVSPLQGFEEQEFRLKQYALYLRNCCTAMKVQEEVEYNAEFKVVRGFSNSDNDMAIKVEVTCSAEGKPAKLIYTGILMSWGASEENTTEFLYLPILLCRGRTGVKQLVHRALHMFFDCIITPFYLTHVDLIWLNGLFLSISDPKKKQHGNVVKIVLIEPWKSDAKFEYSMIFEETKAMWDSIHPENADTVLAEEVRALYDGLMEHLTHYTLMKLESFKLSEIKFPDVVVKANGKISCRSVEILDHLLCFLYSESPRIDVTKATFEESFE